MKSLADKSFFNLFDRLVSRGNPAIENVQWRHARADWHRERHSYAGRAYGFTVETTIVDGGTPQWTLLVVREYWWAGSKNKDVKSTRWAKVTSGEQRDVLAWMRQQQRTMER